MNKNIIYKSKQIKEFFKNNRQSWDQFYPSERWVFEHIAGKEKSLGFILDVGCACGGLKTALSEQFQVDSYVGIDINEEVIQWANEQQDFNVPSEFICGDILTHNLSGTFNLVTSLSCADWNIETDRIVEKCWSFVKPGGYFVISLRVVPGEGINDIKKSYQHINYTGDEQNPEIANYVVVSFDEIIQTFKKLEPSPSKIGAYGYWGNPSKTAVTPYKDIVFAVFYIQKSVSGEAAPVEMEFSLPQELGGKK